MSERQSKDTLIVVISSTARDLPEHREQAMAACLQVNMLPKMMEHLPSRDEDAIAASLRLVDEADIYLGIFAHRYGYVPAGHDVSITEMEYNRAAERGIPCLIFFMHDEHPVMARDIEKGPGAAKLEALRERLSQRHVTGFFRSPTDLRADVLYSLGETRNRLDESAARAAGDVSRGSAKPEDREIDVPLPPSPKGTGVAPGARGEPVPPAWDLFTLAVGEVAGKLLRTAARRQVHSFFAEAMPKVEGRGQREPLEAAMVRLWAVCVGLVLDRIRVLGDFDLGELHEDEGLAGFANALTRFLDEGAVGSELLGTLLGVRGGPDAAVLQDAWSRIEGPELPSGFSWEAVAAALRRRLEKKRILTPELRARLDLPGLVAMRAAASGFESRGDEDLYLQEVRHRSQVLDLGAMKTPGGQVRQILLRDAFVAPRAREDPPPVQLPGRLEPRRGRGDGGVKPSAWQLQRARDSYAARAPEAVLDVITDPAHRHLVLLGSPGAGKSTLIRFLLASGVEGFPGAGNGPQPPWARALEGHLPLFVELGDFAAAWAEKRCHGFASYWHRLGARLGDGRRYHLDEAWLKRRLTGGPGLVLLDGMDQVYDTPWRERVLGAIVEFAGAHPLCRVIVTSRPAGYSEAILRGAHFRHYALEDFDDGEVRGFLDRWSRHVFPVPAGTEPLEALIPAVAASSPGLRLMAGNPLLLTALVTVADSPEPPRDPWGYCAGVAQVLCHSWDVSHHLAEAGCDVEVSLEAREELLGAVARTLVAEEGALEANLMARDALCAEVESWLRDRYAVGGAEGRRLARQLLVKLRRGLAPLCPCGHGLYGFLHPALLEHYYARALLDRLRQEPDYTLETLCQEVLAPHWRDRQWRRVLRLVSGRVGDRDLAVLVRYLVDAYPDWRDKINQEPPVNLVLALQCLGEAAAPEALEGEAAALVDAVVEVVEHPGPWRSAAVAVHFADELLAAAQGCPLPEAVRERFEGRFQATLGRIKNKVLLAPFARLAAIWLRDSPHILRGLCESAAGEDHATRGAALVALAQGWPDDREVRSLVLKRARSDEHHTVQVAALEALVRAWPRDAETRSLLCRHARDAHYSVRRCAVQTLARLGAGDDAVWELLSTQAVSDPSVSVRAAALEGLAHGHRNVGPTRSFLCQRAREDEHHEVRETVLRLLGQSWPGDEETRSFLARCALQDESEPVRQAALEALVRTSLDPRSLLLLSRDLDGQAPFLDPREPVAPAHLRQGAGLLGIPEDEARKLLASSEAVLGWNPLQAGGRVG